MRPLLDECVDARLAGPLRSFGHDVTLVQTIDPSAGDRSVLALALGEARVLVTTDFDFGELLVRTGLRNHGVVLLRLEGASPERRVRRGSTRPSRRTAPVFRATCWSSTNAATAFGGSRRRHQSLEGAPGARWRYVGVPAATLRQGRAGRPKSRPA